LYPLQRLNYLSLCISPYFSRGSRKMVYTVALFFTCFPVVFIILLNLFLSWICMTYLHLDVKSTIIKSCKELLNRKSYLFLNNLGGRSPHTKATGSNRGCSDTIPKSHFTTAYATNLLNVSSKFTLNLFFLILLNIFCIIFVD
jgi:hypothetical protein